MNAPQTGRALSSSSLSVESIGEEGEVPVICISRFVARSERVGACHVTETRGRSRVMFVQRDAGRAHVRARYESSLSRDAVDTARSRRSNTTVSNSSPIVSSSGVGRYRRRRSISVFNEARSMSTDGVTPLAGSRRQSRCRCACSSSSP